MPYAVSMMLFSQKPWSREEAFRCFELRKKFSEGDIKKQSGFNHFAAEILNKEFDSKRTFRSVRDFIYMATSGKGKNPASLLKEFEEVEEQRQRLVKALALTAEKKGEEEKARLEAIALEADRTANTLKERVAQLEKELSCEQEQGRVKDRNMKTVEECLRAFAVDVDKKNEELKSRDEEIRLLTEKNNRQMKDAIQRIDEIEKHKKQIAELNGIVGEQDKKIKSQEKSIEEKAEIIADLKKIVADLERKTKLLKEFFESSPRLDFCSYLSALIATNRSPFGMDRRENRNYPMVDFVLNLRVTKEESDFATEQGNKFGLSGAQFLVALLVIAKEQRLKPQ